jgi:hypothetical protein
MRGDCITTTYFSCDLFFVVYKHHNIGKGSVRQAIRESLSPFKIHVSTADPFHIRFLEYEVLI